MEVLQMYPDVPAIELGTDDFPNENFSSYSPSAELSQYWRSIDPSLNSRRLFGAYQTDTSAHLVNMEKHLLHLANSAYGCGPVLDVRREDFPPFGRSTIWGSGGEAVPTMGYMSPNRPWASALSSTNSTASDYAFSPDVSRHHASLFREDSDSPASFGSPYPVPFPQMHYGYSSQGSHLGHAVASPSARDQAVACSMKELQYAPDPQNEDNAEDSDCIKIETRPGKMAPTPEVCCLTLGTPERSEYDDSMKDEDEDEEKGIDSDVDPAYSPSRNQPTRRISSSSRYPARSPTFTRTHLLKPMEGNKILKPSQRPSSSAKTKTKALSKRRSGSKNSDGRPFICSFSHYGCESRFSSKNEWKRHVSSQHLQLGFYRCDTGHCLPSASNGNRSYNDFNRKDLFTQHHRRMHTPWSPANKPLSKKVNDDFEEGLEAVRLRCWQERRQAPKKSQCIFCAHSFVGEAAWEERMEHIGKHFERADREKKGLGGGDEDLELRAWAVREGIVVDCGEGGFWLDGLKGASVGSGGGGGAAAAAAVGAGLARGNRKAVVPDMRRRASNGRQPTGVDGDDDDDDDAVGDDE